MGDVALHHGGLGERQLLEDGLGVLRVRAGERDLNEDRVAPGDEDVEVVRHAAKVWMGGEKGESPICFLKPFFIFQGTNKRWALHRRLG